MCKTAYIIATYGGQRLHGRVPEKELYLREHLQQLTKIQHNIDTIIVVVNTDKTECPLFTQYIESLPDVIGRSKLIVERRENVGLSYGAFNHAFEKHGNKFDYFILLEDDYIPVEDNFDTTLIRILKERPATVYLCALLGWMDKFAQPRKPHARISYGIMGKSVIQQVLNNGGFDYSKGNGQASFSQSVLPFGELTDLSNVYLVPYFLEGGHILNPRYTLHNDKTMFIPYQFKDKYYDRAGGLHL